jgi:hypothetical protein
MKKLSVVFAKITQYPEVRTAHLGDIHKGDVFLTTLFYLAGTEYTATIGIDKNRDNQLGMIGMLAFIAIKFFYSRRVKLIEKVTVNKTLVIVWKQIKNIVGG